jgi:hypothetical protein
MNKNDILYSNIIRGLQGKQPSLERQDDMIDGVMARITQRKHQRVYVIVLRVCAIAASLALVFGISVTVRDTSKSDGMASVGLQQTFPQKTDGAYFQNKYLKNDQYELIKQSIYENKR